MEFALKNYQQRCLDELTRYLRRTWELQDADTAFYEQTRRVFHPVENLKGLPYVCVRVPTGGGKTILAAHSVGIAAENLLRVDKCLVLWLAPTTQIVEQTFRALQDNQHPYRRALDESFDGRISVMDLKSAHNLQRGTLETDTVIIVSTMAAFRVEDTEGRKIYEDSGLLMSNFENLTEEQKKILIKDNGVSTPTRSLANLLRLRRPLIIVDEAHNARTSLSFESLARFNPSCILEFSATPNQDFKNGNEPSNVLTHVSAAELKAEDMIKMPIYLKPKPQWVEAVQEALDKRSELEQLALEEKKVTGEYIRPIILFQAQRNVKDTKNITYDVLKKALIEEFKIPEEQIAISTGGHNDLEGIDVLDPDNQIRCIITVDKLREGWDCPFAYILCTVSSLHSTTAVEQILGRILRMPYVKSRTHEELNRAYAFATSSEFIESANALTEALVDSGFERFEAKTMVRPAERKGDEYLPLFHEPVSETVTVKPDISSISKQIRERLNLADKEGKVEITYTGPPISPEEAESLKAVMASVADKRAIEKLVIKSRGEELTPASLGERFTVPYLAVRIGEQLELFEDQFREYPWKLSECSFELTEEQFSLKKGAERIANIDVDTEGHISYSFMSELGKQLFLLDIHGPQNEAEMAVWLDFRISHPDITPTESTIFLGKMIRYLLKGKGVSFEELVSNRWKLKDAAQDLIAHHRRNVINQNYQMMLSDEFESPLEVDPTFCFMFDSFNYPASRFYDGNKKFNNHFYLNVAQMNGEEADCAAFIDSLEQVEYWIRNLERSDYSFWLQTSSDKFYPDFIVQLKDGRVLVVEYKGGHIITSDDTDEKTMIGNIWAAKSKGRCVFAMVGKDNYQKVIQSVIKE